MNKIISKVLARRLKLELHKIIASNQSWGGGGGICWMVLIVNEVVDNAKRKKNNA